MKKRFIAIYLPSQLLICALIIYVYSFDQYIYLNKLGILFILINIVLPIPFYYFIKKFSMINNKFKKTKLFLKIFVILIMILLSVIVFYVVANSLSSYTNNSSDYLKFNNDLDFEYFTHGINENKLIDLIPATIPPKANSIMYAYECYEDLLDGKEYYIYASWSLPESEYNTEKGRISSRWKGETQESNVGKIINNASEIYINQGGRALCTVMFYDDERKIVFLETYAAKYLDLDRTIENGKPKYKSWRDAGKNF